VNGNTPRPLREAFETAIVYFLVAFTSAIIATGSVYPPSASVLYGAFLPSLLAGAIAWARARGIQLPAAPPTPPVVP